ncbi:MAG: sulfite exporter TauE/SafE family protein [Parcubacteria group bacterium]|nr:sulfite exporter TauE/SafE family protein [Parcubacteria group bacterium]
MDILLITLLAIVASMVGTLSGFGASTIMVPALLFFFPPVEAIFLVAILHWFGDVWKVALFRKGVNIRLILLFGAPGLLLSALGAYFTISTGSGILLRLLGAFLVLYALFVIVRPRFKLAPSTAVAITGGALSGFFAGVFGMGGALRAAFLSIFNLPKAVYIATLGAIGLAVDVTRIATYLAGGAVLPPRLWFGLLLFIPATFVGARLAKRALGAIPERRFRTLVALFLLAAGLILAVF